MLENEFITLVDEYKKHPESKTSIRKYVLVNLGKIKEITDYIEYFRRAAIQINDKSGEGLSYAMDFWFIYALDMQKALEVNKKADLIFKASPNYRNDVNYLSILNNYLIAYSNLGNIENCYKYATEGISIARDMNDFLYLSAFSTNFVHILNELGLFNKTRETIMEMYSHIELLPPVNRLIVRNLYIKILIKLGQIPEAEEALKILIKDNKDTNIYENILFERFDLDIAMCKNDMDLARTVSDHIETSLDMVQASVAPSDLSTIYLSLARYYTKTSSYSRAIFYYEKICAMPRSIEGERRVVLNETADTYLKMGNMVKAIELKNEVIKIDADAAKIFDQILAVEVESSNGRTNDKIYKILYENINRIVDFGKKVSECLILDDLVEVVNENLKTLFGVKEAFLIVYDKNKNILKFNVLGYEEDLKHLSEDDLNQYIKSHNGVIYDSSDIKSIFSSDYLVNNFLPTKLFPINSDGGNIYGILALSDAYIDSFDNVTISFMPLILKYLHNAMENINRYKEAFDNSVTDYLTKIPNRLGLYNRLESLRKFYKEDFYVVIADIDNFKVINDTFGHVYGDKVLQDFANKFACIFQIENVARIGGEEFIAIVLSDKKTAIFEIERLMNEVRNTVVKFEDCQTNYTISIGAALGTPNDNFEKTIQRADEQLYESKHNGKNKYAI